MLKLFLVLFLGSIVSLSCAAHKNVLDDDWEFLLLAQFWPTTSCIYFRHSGCIIPEKVNNWTIHGLWPSRAQEPQPEDCNDSMPFNYSEIESLRDRLDIEWPYYNKSGERIYLWQHEWDKHGTCAYTLPSLSGEMNYFSGVMNLYQTINLSGVLKEAGIEPSQDKPYPPKNFFDALVSHFQFKPNIVCLYNSQKKEYYIEEIWLCFNKDLSMRDCDVIPKDTEQHTSLKFSSERDILFDSYESYIKDCPKNGSVYYQPIQHN